MRNVLIALLIAAAGASAADNPAAGSWTWTMPGPMGDVTAVVTLTVDGEKLTGEFVFDGSRKLAVRDGTVKGGDVTFKIKRDRPSGGVMEYALSGKVDGDSMKGTASSDMGNAEWSAKRK